MDLKAKTKEIRRLALSCIASIGVGHVGGSMSIAEVLSVLYSKHMRIDPANPNKEGRDRFVLSKGHAGPALYATLASFGYFDKKELLTLNKLGTKLPSHCNMQLTPGVDMTAGSLGQGISCAVGLAIGSKLSNDGARIYVIVGDGESQEGQVWEAALLAAHKKLDNLTVFVDNNKMQIDGLTKDVVNVESIAEKWRAFGFEVTQIDGHDEEAIDQAITKAKTVTGKPTCIVLNTIKGRGVSIFEKMGFANHSCPVTEEQLEESLKELED
jgi:transketolase